MAEHILFLTGKLARRSLERTLEAMQPTPFSYEVHSLGVSVAALMTGEMILRRLDGPRGADRIIVPGLCAGDLEQASLKFDVPVERGPDDLKDLPQFFGCGGIRPDLSRYDIRIFAEIVDATALSVEAILARAADYVGDGADVIDLGCLPATPFPHLEEAVQALSQAGYQVSVDSLDSDELLRGGRAGAHYLLSLKESSLWLADESEAVPILIPENAGDLDSLVRAVEALSAKGRSFIADSILDPIHFGLTDSIVRYHRLRERYPDIEIMMGVGNLTELTDADTTGINALLLGMMSELGIRHLLTTQVSPHARAAVREADRARRVLYLAAQEAALPRGYDASLLTVHDRRPFPYTLAEIRETAAQIRDPSYRVQISPEGIHVYNRDGLVSATDPFELFPRLERLQEDAPHAFYMGVETARAQIAWQLGKRYSQDETLNWGCAVRSQETGDNERQARLHRYKEAGSTLKAKGARAGKRKE